MDAQILLAVMGTAAGVVSAYYAYVQHQKGRTPGVGTARGDADALAAAPPKETKLWSTAVDKALENFRKARRECSIEIAQQKNFDKLAERFSTSELVLHVKYLAANDGDDSGATHRFELKINKDGDILEMESKGKRLNASEKFR